MSDTGFDTDTRRVSIQLNASDLKHASMLHFWRTLRRRGTIVRLLVFWLVFMAVFTLLISVLAGDISALLPFFAIYAGSTLLGVFVVPTVVMLAFGGRAAKKRFSRDRPMQVPRTVEWDENGYRSRNEYGTVIMPWQEFVRAEENDGLILIYSVENYRIMPKRFLAEAQLQDLRHCMRTGNPVLVK
ncbi:YcxB family protein [Rhizobium panacihumi]|uniref:YcxB family protein n=1 Tax=Rhizobium panacihumi TaxID=2008450 RepID=UPI003D7A8280